MLSFPADLGKSTRRRDLHTGGHDRKYTPLQIAGLFLRAIARPNTPRGPGAFKNTVNLLPCYRIRRGDS
jgi:hypothetical protein